MGDKNNLSRITTCAVLVKGGHAIIKAIYVDTPGDEIINIYDGINTCGELLFSIDEDQPAAGHLFSAPYINHPCNLGIFVDVLSGTTGSIVIVYE
jgi:hypothetical protein